MKYLLFNREIKCVLACFWWLQCVLSGSAQHLASHFGRSFSNHSWRYASSNDQPLDRSPGAEKHMDVRERPNCFASYGANPGSLVKCSG